MDGNTWVELRQRARELARAEYRANREYQRRVHDWSGWARDRLHERQLARRDRARIERQLAKLDTPAMRDYCGECGEEWPCWYSKNPGAYSLSFIALHSPVTRPDKRADTLEKQA